ncbi:similar to Saccharomyces cerevisiae YLR199C PBA1 Protein involved in 20S proteasome assembly [Maudiozyma saulgeensis]|uniref:Similar to Saccharomyces cerevisiae YLR199C PBA1 Protein involved in 20S proteasome assembly n=1 Tax=Maudiozyma saulgeensis TaxID=1789683 RepID=A0A1X7R2L5_9SACH|nr:similar to Saccharomyces cerevisiae YLR199C PBA1 Protein involved in 20S proteasome assembly [Kazachstania saulgeensis]
MLFKQWNELSIPRHELDYPILTSKEESLQSLPLPTVSIPINLNLKDYDAVYITTKLMNPLFPKKFLNIKEVGSIKMALSFEETGLNEGNYSWNFNENFPEEFDPASQEENEEIKKSFSFEFPLFHIPNNNSLLISIDENFLKLSPIFDNVLAKELANLLVDCKYIFVIGTSDRVMDSKSITCSVCNLNPPEFVSGFIGSLISNLAIQPVSNFSSIIVPSEGPTGFEKISLETMNELVHTFMDQWNNEIDTQKYYEECNKYWRFDGSAMSTQSGLYI